MLEIKGLRKIIKEMQKVNLFNCGWMSPAHWKEFVKFIKKLKRKN